MSDREPALLRDPSRDHRGGSSAEPEPAPPGGEPVFDDATIPDNPSLTRPVPPVHTPPPLPLRPDRPPRPPTAPRLEPPAPVGGPPAAHVHVPPAPPARFDTPLPVGGSPAGPSRSETSTSAARARREADTVYVVGFWKRTIAAAIDLAIVVPAALIVTMIASWATGVHLPSNLQVLDLDLWIDLVLASDPALVMGLGLFAAIGLTYLLVFHIVVGRTLGMRLLRIKIIDVYGDRPSAARCLARCAGYLAGVATLFLGFLWMGFDSEKRGLQDWIAGTYVIRA